MRPLSASLMRSECSSHPSPPLSPGLVQLKESASHPPSVPLDSLEVIATLGVGGFGRVELVRLSLSFYGFLKTCSFFLYLFERYFLLTGQDYPA